MPFGNSRPAGSTPPLRTPGSFQSTNQWSGTPRAAGQQPLWYGEGQGPEQQPESTGFFAGGRSGDSSQLTPGGQRQDYAWGGLANIVSQQLQNPANFQPYQGNFLAPPNPGQWEAVNSLYNSAQSFPGQSMLGDIRGYASQLANFMPSIDSRLANFNPSVDTSSLGGTAGDLRSLGQGFTAGTHPLAAPQVEYANKVLSGHYLDLQQNQALQDYLGLITTRSNEAFNEGILPGIADASLRSGSQNNSRRGVATEQAGARHQDRLTQNLAAPTLQAYQFERGQQAQAPGILQGVAGLGGQALGQAGGLYGQQAGINAQMQALRGQALGQDAAIQAQMQALRAQTLGQAASTSVQAGQVAPSLWFGGAQAMGQAGQQAYALDQIGVQNQLAQFQEQQNAPWRPLGHAASILGGSPGSGRLYPEPPEPNRGIQALQGAFGGFGLANSLGQIPGLSFLNSGWGQAGGAGLGALLGAFG